MAKPPLSRWTFLCRGLLHHVLRLRRLLGFKFVVESATKFRAFASEKKPQIKGEKSGTNAKRTCQLISVVMLK
jgi:hypothetical protein